MQQKNNHRSKWVQTEAAKHTTQESIRRRIADEEKHIHALLGAGATTGPMGQALEAHYELIEILTKRLAHFPISPVWNGDCGSFLSLPSGDQPPWLVH
jgi:hypothetical protein